MLFPKWFAPRRCLDQIVRSTPRVAALLLTLFLLVPYAEPAVLLLGQDSSCCGMRSCKGSKVCQCRRSQRRSSQSGPAWTNSSECPCGCGELPAVQGVSGVVPGVGPFEPVITPVISRFPASSSATFRSYRTDFPLFGRPPPSTASPN